MKNKTLNKTDNDFYDELPKEINQLLMESREQIKNGNVSSHEDVMSRFKEKYKFSK